MSFFIADWEVLPDLNRIRRGEDLIEVEPRVMAVLEELARVPGRVVTRDDLHRSVWSDVIVSDDALTRCIRELRRLLGDDARAPKFIETISKRGYRLIAPVVRGAGEPEPPPAGASAQVVVLGSTLLGLHAEVEAGAGDQSRVVLRRENVRLSATRHGTQFDVRTRTLAAITPLFTTLGAFIIAFMLIYGREIQFQHGLGAALAVGIAGWLIGAPARRRALDSCRAAIAAFAKSVR